MLTLGSIVSLQDYEDFARAFAGIEKTLATWVWSGQKRSVFVTVAGAKGAEVKSDSALYKTCWGRCVRPAIRPSLYSSSHTSRTCSGSLRQCRWILIMCRKRFWRRSGRTARALLVRCAHVWPARQSQRSHGSHPERSGSAGGGRERILPSDQTADPATFGSRSCRDRTVTRSSPPNC